MIQPMPHLEPESLTQPSIFSSSVSTQKMLRSSDVAAANLVTAIDLPLEKQSAIEAPSNDSLQVKHLRQYLNCPLPQMKMHEDPPLDPIWLNCCFSGQVKLVTVGGSLCSLHAHHIVQWHLVLS